MTYFKRYTLDDVNGVDDVAKRLAHFSAMRISHHCV